MARVLFFLALLIAAASAFVSPASKAVSTPAFTRTTTPNMIPVEAIDAVSSFAQNANVIATSAADNGGYFYPVAGLAFLSAIILYLSPPLSEE